MANAWNLGFSSLYRLAWYNQVFSPSLFGFCDACSKLKFSSFGSDSLTVTFFSSSSLGLLSCGKRTWRKSTKRLLIRLRIHWNMKICFLNSKRLCRPKRYDSFLAINIVVLNRISLLRLSGQSAGYHSINLFPRNGRCYDVWKLFSVMSKQMYNRRTASCRWSVEFRLLFFAVVEKIKKTKNKKSNRPADRRERDTNQYLQSICACTMLNDWDMNLAVLLTFWQAQFFQHYEIKRFEMYYRPGTHLNRLRTHGKRYPIQICTREWEMS